MPSEEVILQRMGMEYRLETFEDALDCEIEIAMDAEKPYLKQARAAIRAALKTVRERRFSSA